MKEQYVILKIIKEFKSRKTKNLRLILIFSSIVLLFGLSTLNYLIGDTVTYKIVTVVVITSFIISSIGYGLSKKAKVVGNIELNETEILGNIGEHRFLNTLTDIDKIEFYYEGENGVSLFGHWGMFINKDGAKNYLTIYTINDESEYRISFDNDMQFNILKRLLYRYEVNGVFVITNHN